MPATTQMIKAVKDTEKGFEEMQLKERK